MKRKMVAAINILLLLINYAFSESIDTVLIGLSYGKKDNTKILTEDELRKIYKSGSLLKIDSTGKKTVYKFKKAGEINGQRTKENIMNTINTKFPTIRNLYNSGKYGNGNIFVKMDIVWNGQVQNVEIINYTLNDKEFRDKLFTEIQTWNFGEIENKNDTTKIIYPFTFLR